ncbi:MAG TPA: Ig-like domain-containing protein [Gemmatimonadales bacterium]|nr:Ig-like domain-containing protein [Gemmatimonadales bacterium]
MSRLGAMALGLASGWLLWSCSGKESPTAPPVVANITVTPGGDTLATLGRTRVFSAAATDQNGSPVTATIRWHSTNAAVATVDSVTGLVTAVGNGATIVRATASGINGDAIVVVSQAVATVQVSPSSATVTTVGATTQFTAVAKDSGGAGVNGVTMLWISSDPSVAIVDTTGKTTAQKSGHTTVIAAARGIPGNAGLTVNQLAKHLAFSSPPVLTVAGDAISPAIQVEIRDSLGGLVSDSRAAVTVAFGIHPVGAILNGTKTVNAVGGVASFTGLTIEKADSQYTLIATAAAVTADTSGLFGVVPAPVSRVVFSVPDSAFNGGVMGSPSVTLYDRFDNFAYNATDTITLDIPASDWNGHLVGATAVVPVGGVATFPGLRYSSPGGFTLRATARGTVLGVSPSVHQRLAFKIITVGADHVCAITTSFTSLFCWGAGDQGQLGDGAFADDSVPRLIDLAPAFSSIAAGGSGTCGLTVGGSAYCWGLVGFQSNGLPTALGNVTPFASLDVGFEHACGRTSAGAAYCWGLNFYGNLGDSTRTQSATPVAVQGGLAFNSVITEASASCGLVSGAAYCWGFNLDGELGTNNRDTSLVPTAVVGGHSFTDIYAGAGHACGLLANHDLYCWGSDFTGQTGDTLFPQADTVPGLVQGGIKFVIVALGGTHSCGVSFTTGLTYCWGDNSSGELGSNSFATALPVAVNSGLAFQALEAGGARTCGLTSTGQMYCWGENGTGALGDGTHASRSAPTAVVQH